VLFNCNYRCIISSTSSSPAKISFESFELCFVSDSICGNSLSLNNPTDSRNEWKNKTLLSPSNKRQKQKTIDNKKKKYSDIIVGNEKSVEIAIIMFFVLKRKSFPRCFFFLLLLLLHRMSRKSKLLLVNTGLTALLLFISSVQHFIPLFVVYIFGL